MTKKARGSNATTNSNSKNEGKKVKAKTANQQLVIDSINSNHITFAIGPAGCGKTHISVGMAVEMLRTGKVKKIIITRPTISVDEDLGALPGGMDEKLHPFLIPLYDEFNYYATPAEIKGWLEKEILEIMPLGFARGRTFKYAFVILDEAQNASYSQLKMFTTRYGEGSKYVINGDSTQSDLPRHKRGGMDTCLNILDEIPNIGIIELDTQDIVRHPVVAEIVEAFEDYEAELDDEYDDKDSK